MGILDWARNLVFSYLLTDVSLLTTVIKRFNLLRRSSIYWGVLYIEGIIWEQYIGVYFVLRA